MKSVFQRVFLSRSALHILFWSLQIFSDAVSQMTIYENNKQVFFLNLLAVNGLQILLCCVNVFYLVPRLYKNGKKSAYWTLVTVLVIGYSLSISHVQQLLFKHYFSTSEVLSKEIYHFVLNSASIIRYLVVTVLIDLAREWLRTTFYENEQKAAKAASEIRFLRSQLNPHFLFNTLNNIYGLVLIQSPQAKDIILKLSDIMKYTLYEAEEDKVLLTKDIENVLNYIDLERVRQGNNASINVQIDYDGSDPLITPLLFLPLVENAFKHGVNSTMAGAFFRFSLSVKDQMVIAEIENSKGIETEKETHAGIGLQNLRRRLELFYPGNHQLTISDQSGIFAVTLTLRS
ncbi:MAG: histidine kinase [Bacteroidota bacterium]